MSETAKDEKIPGRLAWLVLSLTRFAVNLNKVMDIGSFTADSEWYRPFVVLALQVFSADPRHRIGLPKGFLIVCPAHNPVLQIVTLNAGGNALRIHPFTSGKLDRPVAGNGDRLVRLCGGRNTRCQ